MEWIRKFGKSITNRGFIKMKWYIICYLFGCAIAFPLGMHYQMRQDQKEIETAQINAKKIENKNKARLIACESDIKSTTIAMNFYKAEYDSIQNYNENVRQESITEFERRKTTKEYKIFERCMEKAGL